MTPTTTRPVSVRRRPRANPSWALGFAPLVLLLIVWQIFGDPRSPLFPPPATWWNGLVELAAGGRLAPAILSTVVSFVTALVVATVLGAALGALIGSRRGAERATGPAIQFLMSIPPAAIVPVAALVVGIGFGMQVGAIVFGAIWPILLNSAAAMRGVPQVRLEAARLLGLSPAARFFRVALPSLAPGVLLGVVVAAPIAIVVTLLVEMMTSVPGLGSLLLDGQRSFRASQVFALLVLTGLLGYLLNALVGRVERVLLRNWPEGTRR